MDAELAESQPAARPRRRPTVHQFLIVLSNTDPLVWRRIQVPDRYTFWDLHVAIQDAMGWLDYHLHEFTVVRPDGEGVERFGIPDDEFVMEDRPLQPSWEARVSGYLTWRTPPFLYLYDFGDDWKHIVY